MKDHRTKAYKTALNKWKSKFEKENGRKAKVLTVTGGRDEHMSTNQRAEYIKLLSDYDILVEGEAKGIDTQAKFIAKGLGMPILACPADWNKYSRAAGPIRNRLMAELADTCIVFDGNRGTLNMKKVSEELGLEVINLREKDA